MKKLWSIVRFVIPACLLTSCYSSKDLLKPEGETATITAANNTQHVAEFLYATDSTVVVSMEDPALKRLGGGGALKSLYAIPLSTVKSIEIAGYANRKWVTTLVAFQVIPTVLFGIELASNADEVYWGSFFLVLGLPIVITYALLEGGTPNNPMIHAPFDGMRDFTKYAKFPQGLDDARLSELLTLYGQTELKHLE